MILMNVLHYFKKYKKAIIFDLLQTIIDYLISKKIHRLTKKFLKRKRRRRIKRSGNTKTNRLRLSK